LEDGMKYLTWKRGLMGVLIVGVVAGAVALLPARQQPGEGVDVILSNGKVITVDDRFSIAEAVAVRGDRFVAVGTNAEIEAMAGPNTQRIDLAGRAVVPGLIDNHGHIQRQGAFWTLELRLDGVESRTEALDMIRQKAIERGPGQWVFTMGGFSRDQFADDDRPFTREELDAVAPENPVLLQFMRDESYVNSRAIEAIGLEARTDPWIVRDASGRATGVIENEGSGPVRAASGFLDEVPEDIFESSSMAMLRELNRAGITAAGDACPYADEYRAWADEGRLPVRFFCLRTAGGGTDAAIAAMPSLRYFDGDEWIDYVAWGERLVNLTDNVYDLEPTVPAATFEEWGRMARAAAEAGIPIFIHTTMEWTIEAQLRQVEAIARDVPIRHLRWAFVHMEQATPDQITRMRNLGMYIGVHPRGVISGAAFIRDHGDRAYTMPALKTIQDSGIMWGFGTDAFEVNQYRPFTTLYWAVTGKMVGGKVVMHEPISREDALIAYTRKNARFFFRENDLGSIQAGKLADLVVIDRDYLTIPADDIRNIESVLTMVGGRIVYDAAAPASTQ
jgi:hypothetical protein